MKMKTMITSGKRSGFWHGQGRGDTGGDAGGFERRALDQGVAKVLERRPLEKIAGGSTPSGTTKADGASRHSITAPTQTPEKGEGRGRKQILYRQTWGRLRPQRGDHWQNFVRRIPPNRRLPGIGCQSPDHRSLTCWQNRGKERREKRGKLCWPWRQLHPRGDTPGKTIVGASLGQRTQC